MGSKDVNRLRWKTRRLMAWLRLCTKSIRARSCCVGNEPGLLIYSNKLRFLARFTLLGLRSNTFRTEPSLFTLVGITLGAFVAPDGMDKSSSVLNTLIFAFGGIVTGYLGFATLDDKWHKKQEPGAGS